MPPPTGPYFFYGSLCSPTFLAEVLDLPPSPPPILRPAKISSFSLRLWGQYPALVEGPAEAVVEGLVYDVSSEVDGLRLAQYETMAYRAVTCTITYTDGESPGECEGTVFLFVGRQRDLHDGVFDLKEWLRSIGRD